MSTPVFATGMKRRDLLLGGLVGTSALLLPRVRRRIGIPKERPNIVVICSDQQHWEAMGYVDPFFATPNCDALFQEATNFRQAYCTSPQCSPSRSSMMCGFYPHRTGIKSNHGQPGNDGLQLPHVGGYLQRAGYHTAYHGKWHLGNSPLARAGWDSFRQTLRPADRKVTKMTLRFLNQAERLSKPFALFVMYLEPHGIQAFEPSKNPGPADAPLDPSWEKENFEGKPSVQREFLERTGANRLVDKPIAAWKEYRLKYRDLVSRFDREVGSVFKALREKGLWENTLIVLTSDHGDMDTHHRMVFKGPFMYDQVIRVPTLLRLPEDFGGRPSNLDHYAWVNVDLAPTLLDVAGADPFECDGRSVLPLLKGEKLEPRPYVVGQFHGKGSWVHPIRMLRTERHKYNRDHSGAEELYDLVQDPHELENLAESDDHSALKQGLRSQLDAWIEAQADPFETIEIPQIKAPREKR